MLCVGGAREVLLAEPGTFEIVLGKRLVSASTVQVLLSSQHPPLLQQGACLSNACEGVPGC